MVVQRSVNVIYSYQCLCDTNYDPPNIDLNVWLLPLSNVIYVFIMNMVGCMLIKPTGFRHVLVGPHQTPNYHSDTVAGV